MEESEGVLEEEEGEEEEDEEEEEEESPQISQQGRIHPHTQSNYST